MSETWVDKFMKEASKLRPAPTELMIAGIMVAAFDNLTMNVAYHCYSVGGQTGEQLDMTNYFTVRVPRFLAPTVDGMQAGARCLLERCVVARERHLSASAVRLAVRQGIFRTGVSLSHFCRLFYLDNAEIVANKKRRWYHFLRAAANGRLLERPNVAPLWQPHKVYHPQMPDRLQSSYRDVEHELVVMTKFAREHNIGVLFIAGVMD